MKLLMTTKGEFIPYSKIVSVNPESESLYDVLGRLHGTTKKEIEYFINSSKDR